VLLLTIITVSTWRTKKLELAAEKALEVAEIKKETKKDK